MNGRIGRSRWFALVGLGLIGIGYGWDAAWHRGRADRSPHGAEEVVEAHWLLLLGVVLVFACLAISLRTTPRGRRFLADWLALCGAFSMVVGFAWDSVRHLQGAESPVGHGLIYGGVPLVAIGLPVAIYLAHRTAAVRAPGAAVDRQVDA